MTPYVFQRGETVALALDVVTGDPTSVTAVTAALKPLGAGRSGVDADAVATPMAVAPNGPSGWTLTLSAPACAMLGGGLYLADARLVVAGGVVITDPVTVRIVEAVTSQ